MFSESRDSLWSVPEWVGDDGDDAYQAVLVVEPLDDDGVLQMKACGTWRDIDFRRYFAESEQEVEKARALAPTLRFLGDLRETQLDIEEAGGRFSVNVQRLFRAEDRVAFVVRSCLEKALLRQTVNSERVHFFLSTDSARMWLGAAD